ncbi:MAG: type IX secretion system protein PorQ [Cyclobacteriaceae bacterium]
MDTKKHPLLIGNIYKSAVFCLFLLGLQFCNPVWAQVGGQKSLNFLNLPTNARTAALGGVLVSASEFDGNLFLSNPALLDSSMTQHASLNYLSYFADINYGTLTYIKYLPKYGTWGVGFQYLNYGKFDSYDPSGAPLGEFRSSDFAITIGHSHNVGPFTLGANLKWVGSQLSSYQAHGLLFDLGGIYSHPNKELNVGLVFKNFGFLITDYTETSTSEVPFDVQLGLTFKPEFMPFRFSLTAYNIAANGDDFLDPRGDGLHPIESAQGLDKMFRRLALGTEVLMSKNVNLRVGYNHLIRQELRLQQTSGGAGFSFGFLIKVKAFEMAYSRALYHVAGGTNYITLTSDLSKFMNKKD